jgi:hypothetical protein
MPPSVDERESDLKFAHRSDKHLQSTRAIDGYHIEARDGPLGHVSDLRVDDRNWAIRQVVAEAGHWYSGNEVLISPGMVERISYVDSTVFLNVTKTEAQASAEHAVAKTDAGDYGAVAFID